MSATRLFLFGPRACGKSTVGQALNQALRNWKLVDIDYEHRLRFPGGSALAAGTPESSRAYYAQCRDLLLEALAIENCVNDVMPEIGQLNLRDCRAAGKLILVLPSRFDYRCRRIIAERESKRLYALPKHHSGRHYDARIDTMRSLADLTVFGTDPEKLAKQIMRYYRLKP